MSEQIGQWIEDHGDLDYPLIPAASVLLVRDSPRGLETVLMRRSSQLSFAKGAWVFPGGRIDAEDYGGNEDHMSAAIRAAIRETHEEAGLDIAGATLEFYSHWIPPAQAPKRFATWFFVTRAPEEEIMVDRQEIIEHKWCRPAKALRLADQGKIDLLPPTWMTLHDLTQFTTVDDLLTKVRIRGPMKFKTKMVKTLDGPAAIWDGDAAFHHETEPEISGPRHRLVMKQGRWHLERTLT